MVLFKASPLALWGALDVVMIVLPVCAFLAKSRKAYTVITLIYVPITVIDTVVSLAN
jgi:nicotinamide riboside transporter PnuC